MIWTAEPSNKLLKHICHWVEVDNDWCFAFLQVQVHSDTGRRDNVHRYNLHLSHPGSQITLVEFWFLSTQTTDSII